MAGHTTEEQVKKSEEILSGISKMPVDISTRSLVTTSAEARKISNTIGSKSYNAFLLEELAKTSGCFKTPKTCCLPYGSLGQILKNKIEGDSSSATMSSVFSQLDAAQDGGAIDKSHSLLLEQLTISFEQEANKKILEEYAVLIKAQFHPVHKLLAIRSSSNVEDLKKLSGAGLFDSILNVQSSEEATICEAIKSVWRSLYSRRAIQSRLKYKIREEKSAMAILIQQMIPSDVSFIIHTENPVPSIIDYLQ